jgi:peptidyl-prolyl cis-trans isomerase D
MMQFMRKGLFSGIFIVLLVLGGFSLVLTDWTGSFRSGVTSNDVARIAGERISQAEFGQLVGRALQSERVSPQQAYQMGLVNQILTSEMWNRMLVKAAHGYGIMVGDEALVRHLQMIAAPVAEQNKTTTRQVIQKFIEQQGISETQFLESMRREITTDLTRKLITGGASLRSPLMVDDMMRWQFQKRNARILLLSDDRITDIPLPDSKTLEDFYATQKKDFILPERRTFSIGLITQSDLKKQIQISDAQVKNFYDLNKADITKPEMRTLDMAVYANDAELDAHKLHDQLTPTNDFIETAKQIGKPINVAENSFARDGFLPELADAVFNAKIGDILGPIKSPIGWHVVRLKNILPAGEKTLEEAKDAIRKQMEDEALADLTDRTMDTLDKSFESAADLNSVAKANNMSITHYTDSGRDGLKPDGTDLFKENAKTKAQILAVAFTMKDTGIITGPTALPDGSIGVIQVNAITPPRTQELTAIKDKLINIWTKEQRHAKNLSTTQELLKDMIAGTTTLEDIAAKTGGKVQTFTNITRTTKDMPEGIEPANWMRLFEADTNQPIYQPIKNGLMMAVVDKVIFPDINNKNNEQYQEVRNTIDRAQGNEMLVQYLGTMSDRYHSQVNDALLKQMFAPKNQD